MFCDFCTLVPFAVVADGVGIAGYEPQVSLSVRVKGELEEIVDEVLPAAECQCGAAFLALCGLHGMQRFLEVQAVVLHVVLVHDAHIRQVDAHAVPVDGARIAVAHAARTPPQRLHVSHLHLHVAWVYLHRLVGFLARREHGEEREEDYQWLHVCMS